MSENMPENVWTCGLCSILGMARVKCTRRHKYAMEQLEAGLLKFLMKYRHTVILSLSVCFVNSPEAMLK